MTNWDIITLVNEIRNKTIQGEDFTASEWQSLINANSKKLFDSLLGRPNRYQVNAPVEQKGAGISRKLSTKLRPFYKRETVSAPSGVLSIGSKNMGYLLSIEPATITGRGFDELEPDEYADRAGSAITAPTIKDPVFVYSDENTILLYPSTITSVVLTYYTYPTEAVVVFTTNATTLLKEYGGSSVETGWGDNELVEIAYMCLRDLGINMERNDVVAYANNIINNE